MPLKDDVQKIISGEVLDDQDSLKKYSRDSSIFEIKPSVVVYPKTVEDIKSLVKFITQNKDLSLTVRSGGTDMTGAAIGESVILDVSKYMNKLISLSEDSAVVQPGMMYRDFEIETLKQDLLLPTYPASREICTVGGMVANNAGGELELTYGPINRYVKKIKVILADGNEYIFKPLTKIELDKKKAQKDFEGKIYSQIFELISENEDLIQNARPKTSKNSTGFDLWDVWSGGAGFDLSKLIIGSQGTLGIITEIEFKLIKPRSSHVLVIIPLPDLTQLDKVVKEVLQFKPEAFECYDDQTLSLALNHAWDLSKNFKSNNRLSAFFDLLSDKLKPVPSLTLLANFASDSDQEALTGAKAAKEALLSLNVNSEIKITKKEQEKYWLIRHKSFGLLMKYSQGKIASSFIDDIIVKPEFLPEFLPKLNTLIAPYKDKMVYTLAGHIGDGNFHIIPLMDLSKQDVRAVIPELMEKVFKLVFEYKGSMSAEHNDGLIRGPYLPQMYGEDVYELFKKVKEIFDPKNIFNPNKKTDANFKYSMDHMIKSL